MAPKHQTVDPLTEDEKALMIIAIRLYDALHRYEEVNGKVNVAWYLECIGNELVRRLII